MKTWSTEDLSEEDQAPEGEEHDCDGVDHEVGEPVFDDEGEPGETEESD